MPIDIAAPGAAESDLIAALLALIPPARMPMVSGRAYGVDNVIYAAQPHDHGQQFIYATPIYIPNQLTIESLSVYVATAADATTQTARVGIAVDNGGLPASTLIAEGNAELDLTSPSTLTTTLTAAECSVGWHWLLFYPSPAEGGAATAAILHCIDSLNYLAGSMFHIGAESGGNPSPNQVLGTGTGWYSAGLVSDFVEYATQASLQAALTAIAGVWTANTGGEYIPGVALSVA